MKKIKGLIVAPFTAFKSDGSVDLARVAMQKKFYSDNGIVGAFICGTTGEGSALTMQEKRLLFKEWASVRKDDFLLIGFLGGTSVGECRELALYAKECGLDAVAVTAPYYQKAADIPALCRFCSEVAEAVPDMPFFYYHVPSITNVYVPIRSLLAAMDECIPNLAGVKYTFEDMMDYQLCLNFKGGKYNILWGRDEMLLPALAIGAQGFVGSTYGYDAPIYHEIIRLFKEGHISDAADLQLKTNKLIEMLGKYGNGTGKAFMRAAGLDLGPCRSPLTTLDEEQYQSLLTDLGGLEFDRYKCVFKES